MIKFSKNDIKKFFRHNAKLLSVLVAAVVVLAAYPTQFVKAVKIDDGAGFSILAGKTLFLIIFTAVALLLVLFLLLSRRICTGRAKDRLLRRLHSCLRS